MNSKGAIHLKSTLYLLRKITMDKNCPNNLSKLESSPFLLIEIIGKEFKIMKSFIRELERILKLKV